MKRRDLIKALEQNGWSLSRNGANHDIYKKGSRSAVIPRHSEIKEITAKAILKDAGIE